MTDTVLPVEVGGLVGPVERLLADGVRETHAVAVRETARMLSRELGAGRPARQY